MANSVDSDKTARYFYEPSYLDLHCLQRYLHLSVGVKGLAPGYIKWIIPFGYIQWIIPLYKLEDSIINLG